MSPGEIADCAASLGFQARVVVGADLAMLRALVSNGFPVMVESWFIPTPNDEMGHYMLLKGYEDDVLIFDDSFHGETSAKMRTYLTGCGRSSTGRRS